MPNITTTVTSALLTLSLFACSSAPKSVVEENVETPEVAQITGADAGVAAIQADANPGFELNAPHAGENVAPRVRAHRSGRWHARPVVIKAEPFQDGEFLMNAFYFVRSDSENWESISKKIYGRPDRADLLKSWNTSVAGLNVGSVLYYNSPGRPEDEKAMKPFALDFGEQLDQVQIVQGDTLSGIALKTYGSFEAWREISALNPQLAHPDQIEIGQTIFLQPVKVETAAYLAALVDQVKQISDAPPAPAKQNEFKADTADQQNPIVQDTAPVAPVEPAKVRAPRHQAAEVKTDDAILYMRAGVLLIAVAMIALVMARVRRRKAAALAAREQQVHDFPTSRTGT